MATAKKAAPKKDERADLTDIKDELAGEDTRCAEEAEESNETWKKTINNIRQMKKRVHTSVVDQSKKAEKWHKKVASWPLQKMSKVDRLKQISVDVDEVQTKTIAHGYGLLRTAVNSMDDISEEILNRAEKRTISA